jgi:hypothetical protein
LYLSRTSTNEYADHSSFRGKEKSGTRNFESRASASFTTPASV